MRSRRWTATFGVALGACALAGCGAGSSSRSLTLAQLPLVGGSAVVARSEQCDRGANAYCAIEAVIVNRRFTSSGALVVAEHRRLHTLGWSTAAGDNGRERAAESPGHKVRVTYATAFGDLLGWDMGWIRRPRPIALTLSRAVIAGAPAMSVMLEAGSA